MNRQALRSVCGRSRPDLIESIGRPMSNYFRQFTTTAARTADTNGNDAPPRPTMRQRSVAAASEIGGLVNRSKTPQGDAAKRPMPGYTDGPPRAAGFAPRGRGRVIDVKSLPAGFRGRGGLRGRGGFRGGFRGRGGSGPPGRGRGGFPPRGRGRRRGDGEDNDARAAAREAANKDDAPAPGEIEHEHEARFGAVTNFSPSLTLDALQGYVPAFPSTGLGRAATVQDNLAILGGAIASGENQLLPPSARVEAIEKRGMSYFADLKTKDSVEAYMNETRADKAEAAALEEAEAAELEGREPKAAEAVESVTIQGANAGLRKAIVDRTLVGLHETPVYAADPVGVTRAAHLRDGSYSTAQVDKFERMLVTMLGPAATQPKA